MKRKVYLIQPSFHKMDGKLVKGWSQANCSVDLPMLSATIPNSWGKQICSEYYDEIDYDTDASLVFIVAMSVDIFHAVNIASKFKKRGKIVIFGGHQDSFSKELMAEVCDSCYYGSPGLDDMQKLLDNVINSTLKKEYHFGINIDFPFDYSLYKGKKVRYIQILGSLGCVFHCDYCWHQISYGGGVKLRDVDMIIEDLKVVKKLTRFAAFRDPNFYNKRQHTIEVCNRITKEKIGIKWGAQCPIIIGHDDEALEAMYKAGCRLLFIGFESLEKENLRSVHKPFNPEMYKELALNIKKHGINVIGYFMFGFDYDTPDSYKKVLDFVEEAKLVMPIINILTPVPGTRLYEKMNKEGRLDYTDVNSFIQKKPLYSIPCNKCYFDHPTMSRSEIETKFMDLSYRLTTYERILKRSVKPNIESLTILKMNLDQRKDRRKMEASVL